MAVTKKTVSITEAKKGSAKAAPKKDISKVPRPQRAKAEPKMPTMTDMPSLKKGSGETGPITLLQMNLLNRGYYTGKIDGDFGLKTESAVKEFQKDLGKPASGSVGPKTWKALQDSNLVKARPVEIVREHLNESSPEAPRAAAPAGNCSVVIEGLTRFQAEMLVKILTGNTSCRILT